MSSVVSIELVLSHGSSTIRTKVNRRIPVSQLFTVVQLVELLEQVTRELLVEPQDT